MANPTEAKDTATGSQSPTITDGSGSGFGGSALHMPYAFCHSGKIIHNSGLRKSKHFLSELQVMNLNFVSNAKLRLCASVSCRYHNIST